MKPRDAEGNVLPRPPIPEWYILLDIRPETGLDIFQLCGVPKEEPYMSVVIGWVYLYRSVNNKVEEFKEAKRRQQQGG
jgi:hypothetical protein